jgi:hypothetical protein
MSAGMSRKTPVSWLRNVLFRQLSIVLFRKPVKLVTKLTCTNPTLKRDRTINDYLTSITLLAIDLSI